MDNKNTPHKDFAFSEKQLKAVLNSKEGKRLLEILNRDGGAALKQAASAVRNGDYASAQQILSPAMQTPEAQQLVKTISEKAK